MVFVIIQPANVNAMRTIKELAVISRNAHRIAISMGNVFKENVNATVGLQELPVRLHCVKITVVFEEYVIKENAFVWQGLWE